jgi:hypothetical protein
MTENRRIIKRLEGILRALKRGDMTVAQALSNIATVVREEATAEARRTGA